MKGAFALACGLFIVGLLAPFSSAKPLPLEPPDPDRGVIGVRIKVIPPARIGSMSAVAVYFVRVVDDADRFGAEGVVNSNYAKGRNVYLLNAKPGRYVAVGCEFVMGTAGDAGKAVFSKADIVQTEVEARAGSIVFMGDIEAQSSTKTQASDEAEAHYLRLIAPAATTKGFMARAMSGNFVYTAVFKSIVRDQATAMDFWADAIEKHFKDEPAWSSRISGGSVSPPADAASPVTAAASPTGHDVGSVSDSQPKKDGAKPPPAFAGKLQGNIAANRLNGGTYTSPDGGFELTLPPLITPGARGEERQIYPGQIGVFFADDFGNVYYVMRTDNGELKYDLEKVASGYTVGDALREKQIVPTGRGSELRLAGLLPGGSPVAQETKVKHKTTVQKLDLHQAMSVFVTDAHIYEVAAGVTATHQESDDEMFARAKKHLDAFLDGLHIKAAAAPPSP